eukprot:TRINITY_DN30003_c0_g1_i1.p1 TRINITY_DN30003_c0_g1~~TRINITY_DN30003_c0_g1_i1.p1  ORF type:complete len:389 (+),score=105.26 TRINITY_DN30003_c0_g1_i1:88-1254(+)
MLILCWGIVILLGLVSVLQATCDAPRGLVGALVMRLCPEVFGNGTEGGNVTAYVEGLLEEYPAWAPVAAMRADYCASTANWTGLAFWTLTMCLLAQRVLHTASERPRKEDREYQRHPPPIAVERVCKTKLLSCLKGSRAARAAASEESPGAGGSPTSSSSPKSPVTPPGRRGFVSASWQAEYRERVERVRQGVAAGKADIKRMTAEGMFFEGLLKDVRHAAQDAIDDVKDLEKDVDAAHANVAHARRRLVLQSERNAVAAAEADALRATLENLRSRVAEEHAKASVAEATLAEAPAYDNAALDAQKAALLAQRARRVNAANEKKRELERERKRLSTQLKEVKKLCGGASKDGKTANGTGHGKGGAAPAPASPSSSAASHDTIGDGEAP